MDDEQAVLAANAAFYQAFEAGDPEAMAAVWSAGPIVACTHPRWTAIAGRADVLASRAGIIEGAQVAWPASIRSPTSWVTRRS